MREKIENEWLPFALSIGVQYDAFWRLTPRSLGFIAEGYNKAYIRQIEHENAIAHLQGIYIRDALLSTVGNMFSKKTAEKFEYPKKPFDLDLDGKKEERERESQLELFKASLDNAMHNFNLRQSQEKG